MEESSTERANPGTEAALAPDRLSVRRWLTGYVVYLLALTVPAAVLLGQLGDRWREPFTNPRQFFTAPAHFALKLLVYAIYVSISCTMIPLPTGWLVAALATRDVALSASGWTTTIVVASIGAAASMIANLHDYYVFTWILRYKSVARVRETKMYQKAEQWFARRPFTLLVAFNVLPIPIDVVRMLAATGRYPRRPFAAANFVGRWIRYAGIAAVTFHMGRRGWWMVVALLVLAIGLAVMKLGQKLFPGRGGPGRDAAQAL
jgi:membrane protein YqaA with SNARE-associated domain